MSFLCQDNIKFYILVPVYKTEKYIHECILSILNQTYENFELILVDDGSPDQAGTICDEYAAKDFRVHVIHKENEGQLSARSAAIAYVKVNCAQNHAFCVFVDSDDYLQPNALEVLADVIEEKHCDVVIYGIQQVDDGKKVSVADTAPYAGSITNKRELYKKVFFDMKFNSLCCKAISCALFNDIDWSSYYYIRHGEDLLQSIPIYKNCRNVEFIGTVLYNYRMNPISVTRNRSLNSYTVNSVVRNAVWDFLRSENVLTAQDMDAYLNRCGAFLKTQLQIVCGLSGKYAEYCAVLEKFRNDSYYSMLLNDVHGDAVLTWLKNKRYRCIITYFKCRAFAIKINSLIRNARK